MAQPLSDTEWHVLYVLDCVTFSDGEKCVNFAQLEAITGLSRKEVRDACRRLAYYGYAKFYRALVNPDTLKFSGSGYCVTKLGKDRLPSFRNY